MTACHIAWIHIIDESIKAAADLRFRCLQAAPAAAVVVAHGDGSLPLQLALRWAAFPLSPRTALLLLCEGDLPTAPESGSLDEGIIRLLLDAGRLGLQLLPIAVARRPLAAETWALLPSPCPGLGTALPVVLARSSGEARWLLWHLSAGERARLWTAALSLARAQREAGVELPAHVLARCLSRIFV